MPASILDSILYRDLLHDDEIGACFSERAELEALVRVEAALAAVQGELGVIPEDSAECIERELRNTSIDPQSIAADTGVDGIPVAALVNALRARLPAAHASWLHWGPTSQDIMDTGLVLRLGDVCRIVDARLEGLLERLADLAERYAELPLLARTRHQPATPTGFGAVLAGWGAPLLEQREVLRQLRPRLLQVSLAGASGNSSALGDNADSQRAALAARLGLECGDLPWHCNRTALAEFASCLARIAAALAKLAEDCLFAAQPEIGELQLPAGGASSTMPHKRNPVMVETLLSLFPLVASLEGVMTRAVVHRQQRDGAAWMLEWYALPQICMACGRALQLADATVAKLQPDPARMLDNLRGRHRLAWAETIAFRLAGLMPRDDAQARVKQLCAKAQAEDCDLLALVAREYAQVDWSDIETHGAQLGDAPTQARRFAALVRKP